MATETCQPSDLVSEAKCFECLSEKEMLAIQTYLLAQINAGATTPTALWAAAVAAGFGKVSEKELLAMQVYLMCQIVNK